MNITGTWCHLYDDSQLELSKPARRTACEYVGLMNERNQIVEAKFLPAGVWCRLGVGEQVRFDEVRSLAGGKEKEKGQQVRHNLCCCSMMVEWTLTASIWGTVHREISGNSWIRSAPILAYLCLGWGVVGGVPFGLIIGAPANPPLCLARP